MIDNNYDKLDFWSSLLELDLRIKEKKQEEIKQLANHLFKNFNDQKDIFNVSLGEACRVGNLEALTLLLEEYNAKESSQYPLKDTALKCGQLDVVNYLLKRGEQSDKNSLEFALESENLEMVKLVLSENPQVYPSDLEKAIKKGNLESVKLIIEINPNFKQITPFYNFPLMAAEVGDFPIFKYLVDDLKISPCPYSEHEFVQLVYRTLLAGNVDILKYVVERYNLDLVKVNLEITRCFQLQLGEINVENIFLIAASKGPLELLEYVLKQTSSEKCKERLIELSGNTFSLSKYLYLQFLIHGQEKLPETFDLKGKELINVLNKINFFTTDWNDKKLNYFKRKFGSVYDPIEILGAGNCKVKINMTLLYCVSGFIKRLIDLDKLETISLPFPKETLIQIKHHSCWCKAEKYKFPPDCDLATLLEAAKYLQMQKLIDECIDAMNNQFT